jgi:hypothetical protein
MNNRTEQAAKKKSISALRTLEIKMLIKIIELQQ